MTEVEAIFLGAVIGGTIGIIGAIIGNKMSRSTTLEAIRNTDFNKAAAVFRSAFTRELRDLRNIGHPEELEGNFVAGRTTLNS